VICLSPAMVEYCRAKGLAARVLERFFAWRTDERFQQFVSRDFTILDFHTVAMDGHHYQSLTLRATGPYRERRPTGKGAR